MGMSMPERVLARLSSGWAGAKRVEWLLFSNLASTLSRALLFILARNIHTLTSVGGFVFTQSTVQ